MTVSLSLVRAYAFAAGACDTATGVLLVTAPAFTLRLMGIGDVPDETVFLRFIGTFVGAVGLSYLLPLLPGTGDELLRPVLLITALSRACVGSFVLIAITASSLAAGWWVVAATDLVLAAVQLTLLPALRHPHHAA